MRKSRPYASARRQRQANETRREILRAAFRLISERGYAATTLGDIAAAAGVSVPTVYASVGSKAKIALALVDFLTQEADIPENDRIQQATTTGPDLLRANVHLVRVLNERFGGFILALEAAADSEPDLVAPTEAGRRLHREAERRIARRLDDMNALREGLSVEDAGAILATVNSYEVVGLFARLEGWSYDRIEAWLVDSLMRLLLKPELLVERSRPR